MPLTAYVRTRNSYLEQVITYDLGPVDVTKTIIDGYYTKSGFKPQAATSTEVPSSMFLGDGVLSTAEAGPYVRYSAPAAAPTIATPDEMLPSQKLRDREYQMTYLTFYGAAATGKVFTTDFGTDANQLNFATAHGLWNGQLVTVSSATALPAGLLASTLYYIVNRTATTVELAQTVGGTPVTLTGNGTGVHSLIPFTEVASYARSLNPVWGNGPSSLMS
jgi:hypothetical protein